MTQNTLSRLRVWQAALVVVVVVAGVMGVRFGAHGADPTFFVVASPPFAKLGTVPSGFDVQGPGGGYDGMFFYSLAVEPLQRLGREPIPLDNPPYRQQRIVYPAVAHLLALGSRSAVPWTLILVNLAAMSAVAFMLARRAEELGRPPIAGAVLALAPGLTFAFARDLSEPLALAFVLAAFAAARSRRWIATALFLTFGILTRETALLAGAAIVVGSWLDTHPRRIRPHVKLVVAALSAALVAFGWQLVLAHRWGTLPILSAGSSTTSAPFVGFVDAVRSDLERRAGVDALSLMLLVLIAALIVAALIALPRSQASSPEKLLFVAVVGSAAVLGSDVWVSFGGFARALNDAVVFGGFVLLGAPTRFRRAIWLVPIAWLPLAAYVAIRP